MATQPSPALEEDNLKENLAEASDGERSFWSIEYPIQAWLDNVSAWDRFCHVKDPDTDKDLTIVTPNRKAYMQQFLYRIQEFGKWDDEKEIPLLAEKEFEKVDKEFAARYQRVKNLPASPFFPKVHEVQYIRAIPSHYALLEHIPGSPFLSVTLGPFQIIRLLHELFNGLAFLHRHKLLHRRIKSESELLHRDPAQRKIKSAMAAGNYLAEHWPQVVSGEREQGYTFTITME